MTDTGGSEALRAVLREFVDRFAGIDNGYCKICGRHRLHDTRGNPQPCSDPGCLSNRAAGALVPRPLTDTSGEPEPKETTCPHCMTDLRVQWDERGEIVSVLTVDTPDSEPSADAPAWQPIATAPKDGTVVIVARDVGSPWGWVRGYARWDGVVTGLRYGTDPIEIVGWISCGFADPPGELGLAHPTHWMPLPTAPVPATEGETSDEGTV